MWLSEITLKEIMPVSKYKIEMIIELKEGHPRKWIPQTIEDQLYQKGESILKLDIKEIEDE